MCWQAIEHESAVSEQLDTMSQGALHHQTWDAQSGVWSQKRSPPQPNIDLWISARTEDFRLHGHTLRVETKHLAVTGMADTGCQSCLAGPSLLTALRLSPADLIPVNLRMRSASGTKLPILGAALLRIKTQRTGVETRQMVYFSPIASTLYLSLATCTDLGLIPRDFPLSTPMPPSGDDKATRAAPGPVTPDLLTRTPAPHHENALQHLPDHPTGPPRLGNPINTPTPPTGNGQAGTLTRGSHPRSANPPARPRAPPTPMTPQPRSTGSPPG